MASNIRFLDQILINPINGGGETILNSSFISTGSITASVDVGINTFRIQSGSSTFFTVNSSSNAGLGPNITIPTGEFGLSIYSTTSTPHTIIIGTDSQVQSYPTTSSVIIGGLNAHLDLYNPTNTIASDALIGAIRFRNNDTPGNGTTKAQIAAYATDTSPDGYLVFSTQQNASPSGLAERMRITNTGLVGIGTPSPLSLLTISGGDINIENGYSIGGNNLGSYAPFIRYNTNVGTPSSSFGHTSAYMLSELGGAFGANDLSFYAGAITQPEIMRIQGSTGFVGIGESSPSAKLEIRGSGATSATTALRVENSNQSASLLVRNDGNIGIGTTNPQARLHISGSTSGSILEPTSSGVPTFTGRDGQFIFGSSGGNHFIYVYMAGAWRSSSLS